MSRRWLAIQMAADGSKVPVVFYDEMPTTVPHKRRLVPGSAVEVPPELHNASLEELVVWSNSRAAEISG